jgi:hypothetical protein
MTIYLALLIAILGALAYLLAKTEKYAELGRIAFFAGLLTFLLHFQASVSALR